MRSRLGLRAVQAGLGAIDRLNARYPWSYNDAYRRFVLRQARVQRRKGLALDLGCGTGRLVIALASRFDRVVGIERDAATAAVSRRAARSVPGVEIRTANLLAPSTARADLVIAVAVLHQVPLVEGIVALRHRSATGGRLVVLGVHRGSREAPIRAGASLLLNPVMGALRARSGSRAPLQAAPTAAPETDWRTVRRALHTELPRVRIRHGLWWRWTAVWSAPTA